MIFAASGFYVGIPHMLWSTSVKVMLESKISEPEAGNGNPLAIGLIFLKVT